MSMHARSKGYSIQKNPSPLLSVSVRVPYDTYLGIRNLAETKTMTQQKLVVEALQGLLDRYGTKDKPAAAFRMWFH
jgi:hypothetical protein